MDVHIVVKGDTLWKIARQYGISFEDLKRVNAHLANPDYIVPGMKIFLPVKKKEHMPNVKGPEKKPQQGKPAPPAAQIKPPTHKKPETGMPSKPSKPMQPIPLPPLGETVKPHHKPSMPPRPTPPVPPAPTPPVSKPTPPVSKPKPPEHKPPVEQPPTIPSPAPTPPTPIPPAPQVPPMAMPQFCPPMMPMPMPIPCGWMPIFDADCYPMVHHPGMGQPMPLPMPMPLPTPQLPSMPMQPDVKPTLPAQMGTKPPAIDITETIDEYDWDESPIYPGMETGTPPSYPTSGWEMMESPDLPHMDAAHDMVHCPPEHGYVPQMIAPEHQNPYGMMMHPQQQFFHCLPCQPIHHHGCHQHGYHPQMMMPMQQMQPQQWPMEQMPSQQMPMQQWPMQQMQPPQWPMEQMPMNEQPYFNQSDNNDCGSC